MVLGAVLVVLGVGSLFLEDVGYVTEGTVIDVGPLELTAETVERVGLPLWLSFVLVGAGVGSLVVGGLAGRRHP